MAKIRTIEDFKINNEAAGKVFDKGFFLVDCQYKLNQLSQIKYEKHSREIQMMIIFLSWKPSDGCCDTVKVEAPTDDPAALDEDVSGVYILNVKSGD